jgi:phosphoribosyl 1,2-cyclic phosphate phosphodiesterase
MTGAGVLTARILGCGSSGGVPRIGGDWGACDPAEPRNRRSRCSLLLTARGGDGEATRVLIDTSPDIREQLLAARLGALDAVVFSHSHADQCHGIDDLRALALRSGRRIPTFMDAETAAVLTSRFDYCFFGQPPYPAILEPRVEIIAGRQFSVDGRGGSLTIGAIAQDHGGTPSLGFRVGGLAYCNDVVELPEQSLDALTGLDVLVVDTLRYRPHPTHAHLAKALGWIERLGPARAILTNLHVDLDYRTLAAELPAGVEPAYDGQEVDVALTNFP